MDQIGKYEILDKIGTGGFAVVYKGYDPFIKRPVAIKVCYLRDEETCERFKREAEIAGRLHHRNITTIYDFGMHESMPYLVEEYLSGEDLAQLIRRREPETPEQKIEYLIQIADGMFYAHGQGVIHRDIKPSNIRVLENGRIKIMDFGTAKLADKESNLTQTGMTLGTVAYLSPERLLGHPCGTNSDIFSFGVLAYELLSFRRPFTGRSIPNLIDQVLNASPVPLTESWTECPPRLAEIVHKCLQKEPTRRYAALDEVRRDLDEVRLGEGAGETIDFHESSTSVVVPPKVFQVSSMMQRARQHYSAGRFDRAKMLVLEALELDERNPKALRLLKACREAMGETHEDSNPGIESEAKRRLRKIREAHGSIETYLSNGEIVKAAQALKFAIQMFGQFDDAPVLRERLVATSRDQLVQLKSAALKASRKIVETMHSMRRRGRLSAAAAENLASLAETLDPDDRQAQRLADEISQSSSSGSEKDRLRKQAEAIASIETMITQGDAAMAEQALRFAIHLHGELEPFKALEERIHELRRAKP